MGDQPRRYYSQENLAHVDVTPRVSPSVPPPSLASKSRKSRPSKLSSVVSYDEESTKDSASLVSCKEIGAKRTTNWSAPPSPKDWPVKSDQVAKITVARGFVILFDFILASTPLSFIVLAAIAAYMNGKKVDDYGAHLEEALLLSPTIFPIVFAALMGRCFKSLGLFGAERGITLGRLEHLVGCQSLFTSLERQIALRSWSFISISMTIVWLLSPIGGQSALRLLDVEMKYATSNLTFNYLSPTATSDSVLVGASAFNGGRSTYTSIFLAALLSSSKYQDTPQDLWSNVKLPAYSSLDTNGTDGWRPVPSSNVTYASLIGIPVSVSHSSNAVSTFNIKARQWDISCSSNADVSASISNFGSQGEATWKLNLTNNKPCEGYPCSIESRSLDINYNVSYAQCEATYQYVEVSISCTASTCRATKMRLLDTLSDGYTSDLDSTTRVQYLQNQMLVLPGVDTYSEAAAGQRGSTNMEKWMYDPNSFIGVSYDNVNLYNLSAEVFAKRFTILWNTFFMSTYASTAIAGDLPSNLSSLQTDVAPSLVFNATTTSTTSQVGNFYKINWSFFTSLFVASFVLLVAAYTGLVLKYITLAPDIIGYASSMTFNNPYIPTPIGGTTLNGLGRAAVFKDLRVKIGDVHGGGPMGVIAMGQDDGRTVRLDKRRWYL